MSWLTKLASWFRPKRTIVRELSILRPDALPDSPAAIFASANLGVARYGDQIGTHPGSGLTPARLVAIFRLAEMGYTAEQCDLFEDLIENDGHLRSQVQKSIDSVAGKTWIVEAGGEEERDVVAARELERRLRASSTMREFLEHQLSAKPYGFACTEIVWEFKDGWWEPAHFANTPHRRFRFDVSDQPRLITDANRVEGEALAPGKWVISRAAGRTAARAGLMRTAAWWALFKRMAMTDWIQLARRFGIPYVTGTWEENASKEDKEVVKAAAKSLGKDGWAAFSKACDLVIQKVDAGGSDGVHGAIKDCCDAEISKLFSGGTLTADSGTVGSYAQSRVHADEKYEIMLSDAERLAHRFQMDLGKAFVKFNGLNAAPPRLRVHLVRDVDPLQNAQVLSILMNECGLEVSEEQVRRLWQFKAPGAADKALHGTKTAKTPGAAPPDAGKPATP